MGKAAFGEKGVRHTFAIEKKDIFACPRISRFPDKDEFPIAELRKRVEVLQFAAANKHTLNLSDFYADQLNFGSGTKSKILYTDADIKGVSLDDSETDENGDDKDLDEELRELGLTLDEGPTNRTQ